jgi:hypothetical protein
VILKAGDVFTCVRRGKIVVTALEKATLQMAAGDTPSPRRALRG